MTTQQILQGVHDWTNGKIVYDISVAHPDGQGKPTPYADLTAALGTGGANIPEPLRKGGMSVKFIQGNAQSSDKYIQFRCKTNAFTTDTNEWIIESDNVLVENPEFVDVKTDSENKLLEATRKDGTKVIYTDLEVKGKQKLKSTSDFIFEEHNDTLQILFDKKVDKEEGKQLIDTSIAESISIIEDPEERLEIKTDSEDKILSYRDSNGALHENVGVYAQALSLSKEGIENFSEDLVKEGFVKANNFFSELKFIPILKNLKRSAIDTNNGLPNINYSPVNLLVYTDIHRDIIRNQRILDFKKKYAEYIDDALLCGDITGNSWESEIVEDFYHADGMTEVLKVIGNHDVNPGSETPTRLQIYNRYMENIENWGVVQPEGAAESGFCYYYKDYTEANVRLIVLDYTTLRPDWEQYAWLEDVLADAKDNNLSVIATLHIPFNSQYELFNVSFNCIDYSPAFNMTMNPETLSAIDTFIDNGGDFICWLFGHAHTDWIGKYTEHSNQIYITLGSAMINQGHWEDSERVIGTQTEDLFSLISFDTTKKTISLYRVGAQYDRYMRHKESLTIDYANKVLLNSF